MKKVFLSLLLSLYFLSSLQASADPQININFTNLKIVDFVKMVAKITKKNILLDQEIKGNVDFVSVQPIRKSQLYDLLLNILDTKGYSIRDTKSGFLKIIKNADVTRTAPPVLSRENISEVQTAIISVKNVSVKNVLRQVNFLLSKYGKLGLSYDSNSVIVTDYPANIKAIKSVLNALDKQDNSDIWSEGIYVILHLLEPIVPHIAYELSSELFNLKNLEGKIEVLEEVFVKSNITYAITISGKKRAEISVDASLNKDEVVAIAKDAASKWIDGKEMIKEIFVPNKLVNFVVK